jgi:DnaJ family protein C protein 28
VKAFCYFSEETLCRNEVSVMEQRKQTDPAQPAQGAEEAPKQQRRRPGQSWADVVEERIRAAQEQGEFENLPGSGRPLKLEENPYAGDRALAFHLLQNNTVLPRELDLGREIDGDLARAEKLLAELRREREWMSRQPSFSRPRLLRAYRMKRAQIAEQYEQALREIRSKTLTLNIIAPTLLHRQVVDVEERMCAFQQEFPPM